MQTRGIGSYVPLGQYIVCAIGKDSMILGIECQDMDAARLSEPLAAPRWNESLGPFGPLMIGGLSPQR